MFEKVNPSHPDKLCDRIAGALVDLAYTQVADPRIAVEVLLGHGICHTVPYYDNPGSSVGLAIGSGVLAAKEIEAFLNR